MRGRNDPCWCGSGKKYKKCHLDEDEAAGSKESPRSLAHDRHITETLLRFMKDNVSDREMKQAIVRFFGFTPKEMTPEEQIALFETQSGAQAGVLVGQLVKLRGVHLSGDSGRTPGLALDARHVQHHSAAL